jgi:hypothetical protein
MAQFTRFYGILEFTRPLGERELSILDPVVECHGHFGITNDGRALFYASEKSYRLVDSTNQLIRRVCETIPDFGLKGQLHAEAEFKPYHWILRIGDDGWARQVSCSWQDVKVAKWAHLAKTTCKPFRRSSVDSADDEVVIRNGDGEVRTTDSYFFQEKAMALLYISSPMILTISAIPKSMAAWKSPCVIMR